MMEKYSTYDVYRNKETGKILREAFKGEFEKLAEKSEWEQLDKDPQDEE